MKKDIQENEVIRQQGQEILSNINFIDPDKIDQYELIINTLEKYRDYLVLNYRDNVKHTILKGMKIEDKACSFFNVPKIDQIIEKMYKKQEIFRKVEKNVDNIYKYKSNKENIDLDGLNVIYKDEVITPPDHEEIKFITDSTNNTQEYIKFQPRLQKILYLLELKGIKKENIEIRIGKVEKNMMRKITYVTIYIKDLEKIIYVCDQAGNMTFLFNKNPILDVDYYDQLTKYEKKEFLEKNKNAGVQIQYNKSWLKLIEYFLLKGNKDIEFKMGDLEKKKELIKEILENEAVVEIIQTIKGVRKLVWKKTIAPSISYQGYKTILCVLSGQALGVPSGRYNTSEKLIPAIRKIYKGSYDNEKFINKDVQFEIRQNFSKKNMVRKLLEKEGVIELQKDKNDHTVLVWKKSIDAHQAYQGFTKLLQNLLSSIYKVNGSENFKHFDDIMLIIRDLYQDKYDSERFDNKNLEFEMSSLNHKKEMLKRLLEDENVIQFKMNGKGEKVLIWENTIVPKVAYQGFVKHLETLLGNITGVNGQLHYNSFKSIIPVIREIFKDLYDKEEYSNKDIEFKMENIEHKKQMIRNLFEYEGIIEIKTNEKNEKVLVWKKSIKPINSYQGFKTRLNILLGKINGIDGGKAYIKFQDIAPVIKNLYKGLYDNEEYQDKIKYKNQKEYKNKDTQFQIANSDKKKKMFIDLLKNKGVINIKINEKNEKVLIWKKSINLCLNYQGYTTKLNILMGLITQINGSTTYNSFHDLMKFIRKTCSNFYDKEIYKSKDMEFKMENTKYKKEMIRKLLMAEGIIEIRENEKKERVLTWKKTVNPKRAYQRFKAHLDTLFSNIYNIDEEEVYNNIFFVIRDIFSDLYDKETYQNKDIEFKIADNNRKKELMRNILENQGVVNLKTDEKGRKILIWKKTINPQLIYQGYQIRLNTLLGYVMKVDGFIKYSSYKNIIYPIRKLFEGLYETEQYENKDIEFIREDTEHKKTMLLNLLKNEGIIGFRKNNNDKNILIWKKTLDPQLAYQGFVSRLATLLGNLMNVNGIKTYKSFKSILPVIRTIFKDLFSEEMYDNKDIEFIMENTEHKKDMIKKLLEDEGVIKIEQNKNNEKILIWNKIINPRGNYQGFEKSLSLLMINISKIDKSMKQINTKTMISIIRKLHKGLYDKEQYGDKDIEFKMANINHKKEMIKKLLIDEEIIEIQENEKQEKLLIWKKTVNPKRAYQGFNNYLCTLFGNIHNINGTKAYKSIKDIIPVIRNIFSDLYDKEEYDNKDIEFEMADIEHKKEMIRNILENQGIVKLDTDKKILVWENTIAPHKAYQGFKKFLQILIGNILRVNSVSLYKNFKSIIPMIRLIYKDLYIQEEYGNKDIEFKMGNIKHKKEMIRKLLIDEGFIEMTENEDKRILIWKKTINPRVGYQGFKSHLNILLGNITGVSGGNKYKSLSSIISAIREVYKGMYDEERWETDKKQIRNS